MFFTSGILIAFFCFAFYLIWDQFLKKDSRLSTGLQVLRKKMSELENLSVQVSSQISRQLFSSQEKCRQLQEMIEQAQTMCERLEKHIHVVEKDSSSTRNLKVVHNQPTPAPKSVRKKESLFKFGKSPFTDVDFVPSPSPKESPDSSL